MNRITPLIALVTAGVAGWAVAQEANLLYAPIAPPQAAAAGPSLRQSSFIYQTLPPEAMERPLEIGSIITVLVDYRSVMQSEGSNEAIKVGIFNGILSDWIAFDGEDIFPAPQRRGDPTIAGQLNSQLRAESDIEQREALTFAMPVAIVDIRPNGNLIIEGRREISVNEEVWMTYLSGSVARASIGPDRVVRDTAVNDLRVKKFEQGAVRDGYARGWLGRWYGRFKPF
ncbi:MAG: flagellar basal body L-ring protein FlgH [Planctomycetota bacterium]